MDLNSYIVDHAGYCIASKTRANGLLEIMTNSVIAPLVSGGDVGKDIFGEVHTAQDQRADIARALRTLAELAERLAIEMDTPQRDERESDAIGFDAAHSVDAK